MDFKITGTDNSTRREIETKEALSYPCLHACGYNRHREGHVSDELKDIGHIILGNTYHLTEPAQM
jgi:queuine/archaeosine tRNA-ribosyltransferase